MTVNNSFLRAELNRTKRLDRVQIAAFQSFFEARKEDLGIEMAFATAIADTCDERFREAVEKRPELIIEWIKRLKRRESHKEKQGNRRPEDLVPTGISQGTNNI